MTAPQSKLIVCYCPEQNELVLWPPSSKKKKVFEAEHIKSKKIVTMYVIGDL